MFKKTIIVLVILIMVSMANAQQFPTVPVDPSTFKVVPGAERPRQQIPKLSSALNQMVQFYSQNQDFRAFAEERHHTIPCNPNCNPSCMHANLTAKKCAW